MNLKPALEAILQANKKTLQYLISNINMSIVSLLNLAWDWTILFRLVWP